jgi:hypothetical protein
MRPDPVRGALLGYDDPKVGDEPMQGSERSGDIGKPAFDFVDTLSETDDLGDGSLRLFPGRAAEGSLDDDPGRSTRGP